MNRLFKIADIFDLKDKINFTFVFLMMLIGMLFETVGVGMIVPLLDIIFVSEETNDNPFNYILSQFPIFNEYPKAQILIIFLLVFYTIKAIFLTFLQWLQLVFTTDIIKKFSVKLYTKYLQQSYDYYFSNNTALLIRNIYTETGVFANGVIANSLIILTEILIIIGIASMLFYYQPFISLVIILILIFFGSIYILFSKKYVKVWSFDRQIYDGQRIKNLQQGFGAVKEIQLFGREKFFYSLFEIFNSKTIDAQLKIGFLMSIPRFWLEWISVLIVSSILLYLFTISIDLSTVIPSIGLFLVAAFKIIPSVSRIISSYQGLSFAYPSVDRIYSDLNFLRKNTKNDKDKIKNHISFNSEIFLDNISYKYPSANKTSLDEISMKILKGNFIGIVGESGSGKSTLIDLITGVLSPHKGAILVDNIDIKKNYRDWQNRIGYVPQDIYLSDDSIIKNIAFGIEEENIDIERVNEVINLANLKSFINDMPNGIETNLGEKGIKMSGGQLQRIGIARALYGNPEVLILDEATSALDYHTERDIMNEIINLRKNKTIIVITHRIESLFNCDEVHKMSQGKLVYSGKMKDLPN